MLRANRKLLRSGGKVAFLTIEVGSGLDGPGRRRGASAGPPATATRSTYPSLLRSAGLVDVERTDLTADYRVTASAWVTERQALAEQYIGEFGSELLEEKTANGHYLLRAIDDGLLKRYLYVAHRR